MYIVGVEFTPSCSPSFKSAAIECGILPGIETLVEASPYRAERRRVLLQVGNLHRRLIGEDRSCISQYLPCSPAQCAASWALGACAWFGQREVLEHDADFVAVGGANLLESRTDPRAVRSLIVRELDDRDRRGCRTNRRVVGRDFDG